VSKYTGLLRIKALLDAYLAALADEGRQAIQDALAEFLGDHPEVVAIAWYQGSGLSHLVFELTDGASYLAAEDRVVGAVAFDDAFDAASRTLPSPTCSGTPSTSSWRSSAST
jgi:hypothetical protein